MRKLIYAINQTVDGIFDHTKMSPDYSVMDYWTGILCQADLLVYGRVTYELMVPFWPDLARNRSAPKAELDFADTFNALDKVVFSRSLDRVDDNTARIVRGDLEAEISALKRETGKDMLAGGIDLPSQLISLGLVDEFLFVVHPGIAGNGRRLMEGIDLPKTLELALSEAKTFESGVVALRYVKK